jgi:predicted O-methyltransferase YrrM
MLSGIPLGSRPYNHTQDIMGTNQEPWMTRNSITFIENWIKNNRDKNQLLEFGCGSSTAWFLKLGLIVTSIEHDKKWIETVTSKLPDNMLKNWSHRLRLSSKTGTEIGSDGEYYDDYVNEIHNLETFDIIIVDGRCRSKCIERAVHKVNRGGIFIVDNAERKIYEKSINTYIPKCWKKHSFPTKVDTTMIWEVV